MTLKFWRIGDEAYNGDPIEGSVEITEEEYIDYSNILQKQQEITSLKDYLASTDYIYPKCLELALDVDVVYADVVAQRKLARTRVQELEASI